MIFIIYNHYSSLGWFIWTQLNDQLPVGSVDRALHQYHRGHWLNPIQAWFFSGLISTTSSVVFRAGRTFHIHFFTTLQIYDFHISTITINQTFLLRSLYSCNSSGSLIFCLGGWKEISISKMNYFNNHLKSADIVASRINTR